MEKQSQLPLKSLNNDLYLKFLETLIKTNQIKEKTSLNYFLNDIEIPSKNKFKKKIKEEKVIVSHQLEDKRILLVEDLPLNFLLAHSVFIGEKATIFEAIHIDSQKICILEESILNIYKTKFDKKSIRKINPKSLFKIKFTTKYELPKILQELKEYTLKNKKIDLNNLHIIDSNKIENFLPTIKSKHFKIATHMGLPLLRPLINNNFIKESTINIKDTNFIKKYLEIMFLRETQIEWDFEINTKEKLYKDISTQVIIEPDKNLLKNKIHSCPITFPQKKYLEKIVDNQNTITLSQKEGKIAIPLWKARKKQTFIPISNTKEFKEITGIEFRYDEKLFENMYIQTLEGEKGYFSRYYLKEGFIKYISQNYESDSILFTSNEDFLIQLLQTPNPQMILKKEDLPSTQIKQYKIKIKRIIKKLILNSIKNNKIEKILEKNRLKTKLILSQINKINSLIEEYSILPSQKKLLKESLKSLNKIYLLTKLLKNDKEEEYPLSRYIIASLNLFKNIEPDFSNQISKIYLSYFKHLNQNDPKIDIEDSIEYEKILNDILELQNMAKNEELYIDNLKELEDILPKNIQYFNNKLDRKIISKINIKKLKQDFPNNYKEKLIEIKENPQSSLKKNYSIEFTDYKNYSQIQKNKFYSLFRIKRSN